MKDVNQIISFLKNEEIRVTSPRRLVAEILYDHQNIFMSAEEIFKKVSELESKNCDQVSVYRTLKLFEKLDLVRKSSFQGEADRFQLLTEKKQSHQHFFKCDKCLNTEPLKGCAISKLEKSLENLGYSQLYHHLEVRGLCPKCSPN